MVVKWWFNGGLICLMVVEWWLNGKNMVPLTHQKGDFNMVERGNPGKMGEMVEPTQKRANQHLFWQNIFWSVQPISEKHIALWLTHITSFQHVCCISPMLFVDCFSPAFFITFQDPHAFHRFPSHSSSTLYTLHHHVPIISPEFSDIFPLSTSFPSPKTAPQNGAPHGPTCAASSVASSASSTTNSPGLQPWPAAVASESSGPEEKNSTESRGRF